MQRMPSFLSGPPATASWLMRRSWKKEGDRRHPHAIINSMPPREREFLLHCARHP